MAYIATIEAVRQLEVWKLNYSNVYYCHIHGKTTTYTGSLYKNVAIAYYQGYHKKSPATQCGLNITMVINVLIFTLRTIFVNVLYPGTIFVNVFYCPRIKYVDKIVLG